MKIRGNTSEAQNEAVVIRQRETRAGAINNAATNGTSGQTESAGQAARDNVRISRVSSEINTHVSAAQIKSERDQKVAEIKARVDAGTYFTPTDELTAKFIEGLSEHTSFFAGTKLFDDE